MRKLNVVNDVFNIVEKSIEMPDFEIKSQSDVISPEHEKSIEEFKSSILKKNVKPVQKNVDHVQKNGKPVQKNVDHVQNNIEHDQKNKKFRREIDDGATLTLSEQADILCNLIEGLNFSDDATGEVCVNCVDVSNEVSITNDGDLNNENSKLKRCEKMDIEIDDGDNSEIKYLVCILPDNQSDFRKIKATLESVDINSYTLIGNTFINNELSIPIFISVGESVFGLLKKYLSIYDPTKFSFISPLFFNVKENSVILFLSDSEYRKAVGDIKQSLQKDILDNLQLVKNTQHILNYINEIC